MKNIESRAQFAKALMALTDAMAMPFHEVDGMLLTDPCLPSRARIDEIEVETDTNSFHVEDLIGDALREHEPENRDWLLTIGRGIAFVWWDRMKPLLRGRRVVFYVGGSEAVTITFHLLRDGEVPVMTGDADKFSAMGIEAYIGDGQKFEAKAAVPAY